MAFPRSYIKLQYFKACQKVRPTEIWIETFSVPKRSDQLCDKFYRSSPWFVGRPIQCIQAIFLMNLNDLMDKNRTKSSTGNPNRHRVLCTRVNFPVFPRDHQLPPFRTERGKALLKAGSHITLETKDDDHHPRGTQLRILRELPIWWPCGRCTC